KISSAIGVVNGWIGRNGQNRVAIPTTPSVSSLINQSSRAKMNSATIRARAAPSCGWPKKSDAGPAPKKFQLSKRRIAGALDRAHWIPGADRIDLRLSDAAALPSRRPQEGARK